MIVVESALFAPAICTDGSNNEACVDTRHELLDGFRVYLSRRTVREAAQTGILNDRDLEAVLSAYPGALTAVQAQELRDELGAEVEALRDELDVERAARIAAETLNAEWAPAIAAMERAAARWAEEDAA